MLSIAGSPGIISTMIIAGIDEAGYGPLLGPLVVGCCAFKVDAGATSPIDVEEDDGGSLTIDDCADWPCLWKRLGKYVSRHRLKTGRKVQINDSKIVYAPSDGLKELERAVLVLSTALGGWTPTLEHFLERVALDSVGHLCEYPWYAPADGEKFPLEQADMPVRLFTKAFCEHMNRCGTKLVHLHARVVLERQFNKMLSATNNKGSALFSISAIHLDQLLKKYGTENLIVICDRQGGREHYGSLLRLMFDDWSLAILREQDGYSDYRLTQGTSTVRIVFREKAEVNCMSVAAASMLCKYIREALMHRFNAYWKQHLPDLAPTAGYYGDGTRFLTDIDAKRRELGVVDDQLIRCR